MQKQTTMLLQHSVGDSFLKMIDSDAETYTVCVYIYLKHINNNADFQEIRSVLKIGFDRYTKAINHLKSLGLIERIKRFNPVTGKRTKDIIIIN